MQSWPAPTVWPAYLNCGQNWRLGGRAADRRAWDGACSRPVAVRTGKMETADIAVAAALWSRTDRHSTCRARQSSGSRPVQLGRTTISRRPEGTPSVSSSPHTTLRSCPPHLRSTTVSCSRSSPGPALPLSPPRTRDGLGCVLCPLFLFSCAIWTPNCDIPHARVRIRKLSLASEIPDYSFTDPPISSSTNWPGSVNAVNL